MAGRWVAWVVACALAGSCVPSHGEAAHPVAAASQSREAPVVRSYGAGESQRGALRIPEGHGPFPVVVLIHGGCWAQGFATAADIEPLGEALVRRGIAVWNIEYRQLGEAGAGWPGTFQDVLTAIDMLPSLARTYPLDLSRVSFVGHSAGAHLALFAASRARLGQPWRGGGEVRPRSVVMIDGPAALAPLVGADVEICGQPVIVPLMGGTPDEQPERFELVSPAAHLPLGVRQLLVEGELAGFMSPYAEAARAAGDRVEVLAPPGAAHFDLIAPSTPVGAAAVDFIAQRAFAD